MTSVLGSAVHLFVGETIILLTKFDTWSFVRLQFVEFALIVLDPRIELDTIVEPLLTELLILQSSY